jgi:hypothetical protein
MAGHTNKTNGVAIIGLVDLDLPTTIVTAYCGAVLLYPLPLVSSTWKDGSGFSSFCHLQFAVSITTSREQPSLDWTKLRRQAGAISLELGFSDLDFSPMQ